MIDHDQYCALADAFRADGSQRAAISYYDLCRLLAKAGLERNYKLFDDVQAELERRAEKIKSLDRAFVVTRRQAALVCELYRILDRDRIRIAAGRAGMTELEAILELDAIVDATDRAREAAATR